MDSQASGEHWRPAHGHISAEQDEVKGLLQLRPADDTYASDLYRADGSAEQAQRSTKQRCADCWKSVKMKLLLENSPDPGADAALAVKLRHALLCPPHGVAASLICLVLAAALAWALLLSITGTESLPGGTFFGLLTVFILCHIGGWITAQAHLPSLLGMLVVGCLLGNAAPVDVARHISIKWSSALRTSAFGIILLRAGLGLNPADLRRLSCTVVRLAFVPCVTEAITCMVTAWLLLDMPLLWGLMLGFVLAAVSPAVVVPSMLSLQERGLGVDSGIPTLVLAASSIDDILAISAFGIIVGITFGKTDSLALTVVRGPLEALAGVVYGIILGLLLWIIPSPSSKDVGAWRLLLLLGCGQLALFGSQAAEVEGAGALGCLVLSFSAGYRWRKEATAQDEIGQATTMTEMPIESTLRKLWDLWQPFLFGLIGATVDMSSVELASVGLGVAVLFIGLVLRVVASFLAVFGAGLSHKQKLFIALAWLPKATVQAAIGSVAYDAAHRVRDAAGMELGSRILMIAVLAIVITAPLGAAAIAITAPHLLRQQAADVDKGISDVHLTTFNDGKCANRIGCAYNDVNQV